MASKEVLHKLKVTTYVAPISADTQAKMRATNAIDSKNYEGNMFVLNLGVLAADIDWTFQLYDSDVSVSDAGAACGKADVIVAVSDNDSTVIGKVDTNRKLTLTAAADGGRCVMFAYIGSKRWIRLVGTSAGPKTGVMAITAVQSRFRYQGRHGLHAAMTVA